MNKIASLVLLAFVAAPLVAHAQASGKEGNGGHPVALEFVQRALAVVQLIEEESDLLPADFARIPPTELREALSSAVVEVVNDNCVPQLLPDGSCRAAINYPARKLIRVSAPAWAGTSGDLQSALAFHEYLGLIGIEKSVYYISAQLTPYLSRDNRFLFLRKQVYALDPQNDPKVYPQSYCDLEVTDSSAHDKEINLRFVSARGGVCPLHGRQFNARCDDLKASGCYVGGLGYSGLWGTRGFCSPDGSMFCQESSRVSVDRYGDVYFSSFLDDNGPPKYNPALKFLRKH